MGHFRRGLAPGTARAPGQNRAGGGAARAVQTRRLAPGTRLPSSRSLAADLGIARNTVADAYGQLVAEGWLIALQGSGTRVADAARLSPAPPATTRSSTRPRQARYDLRAGLPDLSAFPRTGWLSAARGAVRIATGLHAVVELPRGKVEHQVVAHAAARGVAIEGLGDYAVGDHTRGPALVIGYAAPPGHAYSTVPARLTAAIQDQ